jgi:hypothetical protein
MAASDTLRIVGKHVRGVIFSTALGIYGGAICGAAIVSFGMLIGRTGSTGDDIGNWNTGALGVGAMYGAPLGAIVAPIAYATLVRTIGIRQAIIPATVGTLVGGFAGTLILGTPLAVVTGVIGFFAALLWARLRMRSHLAG